MLNSGLSNVFIVGLNRYADIDALGMIVVRENIKNDMDVIEITYCFHLDNEKKESFELRIDANALELIVDDDGRAEPEWIALENNQCPNCPYQKEMQPHCLVAKNLVNIVDRFGDICSYDESDLEVITDERRITQTSD